MHAGGLLPSLAVDEEGALAPDTDEDELTFKAAKESALAAVGAADAAQQAAVRRARAGHTTGRHMGEDDAWGVVVDDLLPLQSAALAAAAVVPGCVHRGALTKGVLHRDLRVVAVQLESLLALLGRLASLKRHVARKAEAVLGQVLRQGTGGAVAGAAVGEETAWFVEEACQRALSPVAAVVGPQLPDF